MKTQEELAIQALNARRRTDVAFGERGSLVQIGWETAVKEIAAAIAQERAEHPGDDAEPVTSQWLQSIGGLPEDSPSCEMFFQLFYLEPCDRGSFFDGEYVHVGLRNADGSVHVEEYGKGGESKSIVQIGFLRPAATCAGSVPPWAWN